MPNLAKKQLQRSSVV